MSIYKKLREAVRVIKENDSKPKPKKVVKPKPKPKPVSTLSDEELDKLNAEAYSDAPESGSA